MNQINMDHKVLGFELTFLQSLRPYFNHCSTVLAQVGFIVWPIIKAICAHSKQTPTLFHVGFLWTCSLQLLLTPVDMSAYYSDH